MCRKRNQKISLDYFGICAEKEIPTTESRGREALGALREIERRWRLFRENLQVALDADTCPLLQCPNKSVIEAETIVFINKIYCSKFEKLKIKRFQNFPKF